MGGGSSYYADEFDRRPYQPTAKGQKALGISGLPYSTVNSILRGKSKTPNLGTIFRISSALNMTIVEFLDVPEILEYSFDDMEDTDEDNALKEGDS